MIKPLLMINKLDRLILELRLEYEEIYQNLLRAYEAYFVWLSMFQGAQECLFSADSNIVRCVVKSLLNLIRIP